MNLDGCCFLETHTDSPCLGRTATFGRLARLVKCIVPDCRFDCRNDCLLFHSQSRRWRTRLSVTGYVGGVESGLLSQAVSVPWLEGSALHSAFTQGVSYSIVRSLQPEDGDPFIGGVQFGVASQLRHGFQQGQHRRVED